MKTPFLGTAYLDRSPNLAIQQSINLYLESVETKEGSSAGGLLQCPGLVTTLTLAGPVRASDTFNGVAYFIAGNTCYQWTGGAATALGTINTSTGPAYITFNRSQVGFWDSTGLWVLNAGVFAQVTLPAALTPVGMPASIDTLTLVTQPGTYNLWQCNANDMTTWPALQFTTEDGNAEPIVGILALHDEILVMKQYSYCFYVNQGTSGFVFGRLPGIYPTIGLVSPQTLLRVGDTPCFLGQTKGGLPRAYALDGYGAREISTYAIANSINGYSTVSDAYAFQYSQGAHAFYGLTFPTGNQTWVYDTRESAILKIPVWHQRAAFSAGIDNQYGLRTITDLNGKLYGGSATSGAVYNLSLSNFQDAGQTRRYLRSWRAAPQASVQAEKCNWLELHCDTGVSVPPGANPQIMLRQSFDGGDNWGPQRFFPVGPAGATINQVRFPRLGATKRGFNADRIFELSWTDVFFSGMLAAETG